MARQVRPALVPPTCAHARAPIPNVPAGYRGLLASMTYDKCVKAYNNAGGDSGLISRAPACAPSDMSKFNLQSCCGEVRASHARACMQEGRAAAIQQQRSRLPERGGQGEWRPVQVQAAACSRRGARQKLGPCAQLTGSAAAMHDSSFQPFACCIVRSVLPDPDP